MLKRISLALATVAGLAVPAHSAGTIQYSLSQQLDQYGKPLAGCKLYFYQAGTTATAQNAYQDSALTLVHPNPLTCDAAGRLPQFFLADGAIKIRLSDKNGVTQVSADNVLVIGPSVGGGGGGASIDATTILATGDLKVKYGTGAITGFVRANGRTIGSATSGATERANSDAQDLFEYLWNADSNLTVTPSRGVSAAADWSANKTIAIPDWRGRVVAGLDDMGNTSAGKLTSTYFGSTATTLGADGGSESHTLTTAELASHQHSVYLKDPKHSHSQTWYFGGSSTFASGNPYGFNQAQGTTSSESTGITIGSVNGVANDSQTALAGSGTPHNIVQPTRLATIYIKL